MSSRAEQWQKRFEWPVVVAALAVIPVMIIEDSTHGHAWSVVGTALNWGSWLVFLAEVVVMLSLVEDRRSWLLRHPLDVAITVLTPPFMPFLGARLLRLMRVLRLVLGSVKLSRLLSLEGIRVAAVIAVTTVIAGGAAFAAVESEQHLSTWDGVWWAITTVTTVGYGDTFPKTETGRVIAMLIMFVGIGFVALLTAFIAERFIKEDVEKEGGDVISKEDQILEELRQLRAEIAELRQGGSRSLPEGAEL